MTQTNTSSFRRVVTGHKDGRPVVLSDGPAPSEHLYEHTPGMQTACLWGTDRSVSSDVDEAAPTDIVFVPGPGQTRLLAGIFPPDAVMASPTFDLATAVTEQIQAMPGLAERFEPDNPGMHMTPSVDYAIVVSGRVVLDLGDGEEVELGPGDVVVQQMTRHAWRVRGDEPAHLIFVLIGSDSAH